MADKKFYWGFMMMLSRHMWADESTKSGVWYVAKPYREENDFDVNVWDRTIDLLGKLKYNLLLIDVGDMVKYETHPEISAPNAWNKDYFKKKLDEIRALGITPIPKLNFSCAHDTWLKKYRRMVSTPEYYQVGRDLIREVGELFGTPELFHIGFDEETAGDQAGYEMITVRGEELWWHDLNFFAKECEKNGSRPWMWSDYMWNHEDLFIKNMSKEIMQSNWFYGTFASKMRWDDNMESIRLGAYELLDRLGFDQILTGSSWRSVINTEQTVGHAKYALGEEHTKGVLVAPWLDTTETSACGLACEAERLYNGRKRFYPETL